MARCVERTELRRAHRKVEIAGERSDRIRSSEQCLQNKDPNLTVRVKFRDRHEATNCIRQSPPSTITNRRYMYFISTMWHRSL
ncbi:hypothetical protein KIN20_022852 [Parelaphostrongylus tenuis]|uniref:Uncharacterized protein n=1 Tax=Parelaphostrongylus tenuis TaxID=148309 RepID=A0AAD5QLU9_PARTN|nr:hypothetical protein KIN20_010439 [Parelaphostrongylus tenuis]KAJ1363085.1 hypothetical protein KIN20_022852 [Parelaphostrongylus tenuis]